MNHKKIKEIIKFSFYKDIQNKWFIIFNVITLVSMIIFMNFSHISSIFDFGDNDNNFTIEVIDNTNSLYSTFEESFSNEQNIKITRVTENTYSSDTIPDKLAIIEINPDENQMIVFSITSKEGIQNSIYEKITDGLKNCRNGLLADKYNLSKDELSTLQSNLQIERIMLGVDAENSSMKDIIKLISSALTYFIAILIFSKISNEIAQEKQSKSSEYILTTVSAKEYMFAKIFSNIAIVLIQGIFLLTYYYIASLSSRLVTISTTDISLSASILSNNISIEMTWYIFALIIYNVLNIIILCIIQAALASKTSSISEAGNTMALLTTVVIICYVVAAIVIDPYTQVNTFLAVISCLPIISEFFIPALIVIGQCHIWQIALSLILLVIAIPLSFDFCSKIFKNGILDYTKVKKKKEINQESIFILKKKMKELGFVIGLSMLIYIGTQTIISLITSISFGSIFSNIFTENDITLITQIILQVISLGLASVFVLAYCKHSSVSSQIIITSKKTKVRFILVAVFVIFFLQAFLTTVLYPPLGLNYDIVDMFDISEKSNLITKIIAILSIAVTPAIFEELFFRKALIDFCSMYSKKFALIFSALLFGLLHMNLSQGLFAFILGIILGSIYLYTNDIKIPMAIHFINNGVATLALILPTSGILITTVLLLACIIAGLVFFLQYLIKNPSREKFLSLCNTEISMESIRKYKYIFADYTFDVSIILVIIMSILTENILR